MQFRCTKTTKSDWLKIKKPSANSHKGDNGRLLIFAGSKKYFGALVFAILAAERFCDLVYVYSPYNNEFIKKLKLASYHIIPITKKELNYYINLADAFLAGCGWEENKENLLILKKILKTKKPVVLDATAIYLAPKNLLSSNVLLTPHKKEFEKAFGLKPNLSNLFFIAKKYNLTILLKGRYDFICWPSGCKINKTGNAGMTKGGTGDCLAGLCGALLARGFKPYIVGSAAAYLNGYAADLLAKKYSYYYNTKQLAEFLAIAAAKIEKQK
jgi:NAD(P)H-hydrate epimerase